MRQRLIALGVGVLFLAAVVSVAVVARGGGELRKLPIGAAGMAGSSVGERAMAADMSMPAFSVTYKLADGVKDPGSEAPAYELGRADAAAAARIAKALGLDGEAKRDGDAFVIFDGSRILRVEAAGNWNFFEGGCDGPDGAVSSDGKVACATAGGAAVVEEGAVRPAEDPGPLPSYDCVMPECPPGSACIQSCPTPEPEPAPERPADLPTKAEAQAAAEKVLVALGLDPDKGTVRVDDAFSAWAVSFEPTVGGRQVFGLSYSVAIGPKAELVSASGWILDPDNLGDYPLAGLATAVKRLNEGSSLGGMYGTDDRAAATDMGAPEPAIGDCSSPTVICDPPPPSPDGTEPAPDGGEPVPPPAEVEPIEVTLSDPKIGLLMVPSWDGKTPSYLVPAYVFATELQDQDQVTVKGEIQVVAVTDELLTTVQPAQPEPATEPGTDPGTPASCSGAGVSSSADSDNGPLAVTVCTSATEVAVGEEVVFEVTAYDEDAPIYTGDCRAAPEAVFGDEEGARAGGCAVDCEAHKYLTEWTKEPGKHGARYTHAYAKPGTYTATFSFQSGDMCQDNPYSSRGSGSVQITVVG